MEVDYTSLISFGMAVFMKIVCFVLGYLTIRLGYLLIASGARGEFKFSAKFAGVKADLASISPGLLFVLLGTVLIGYAMYVEKEVKHSYVKREVSAEKPSPVTKIPPFQMPNGKEGKR